MSTLTLLFHIVLEVPATAIRQHKEIKDIQISRKKSNIHSADDVIPYLENQNKLYQKILIELIHKFSKVSGYKVNVQKSVAFLYTNNEAAEREIK